MIIEKIDRNVENYRASQKTSLSMPKLVLPNKNVDTKDFLYHYPITQKPMVSFGHKVEKATSFEDSIVKYFQPLPEGCQYDKFQIDSARVIYEGNDPVTVAPTGTGKTAIIEYAINRNLAEGKDTICTFPTKALSNEKYEDFCRIFGKENVGLLTGDIKDNAHAPIKIMTTEIYRNMLFGENQKALKNLAAVTYDELHTMNDLERGEVYETAIMKTPAKVQQILLSGTVKNGEELTNWLNTIQAQKNEEEGIVNSAKKAVLTEMSPKERHVPLKYMIYDQNKNIFIPLMLEKYNIKQISDAAEEGSLSEKQKGVLQEIAKLGEKEGTIQNGVEILSEVITNPSGNLESLEKDLKEMLGIDEMKAKRMAAFLADPKEERFNFDGLKHLQTKNNKARQVLKEFGDLANIEIINEKAITLNDNETFVSNMVRLLDKEGKTPALIFKLSKKGCNGLQNETKSITLLSRDQRKEVSGMIKKFKADGYFLGTNFDEKPLLSGSATHHAGRMPGYKKLIETLAQDKLAPATHATSTLGTGINVPSRTTVMTQFDRLTGYEPNGNPIYKPTPINDLHQMMGRAGRRGKDEIGYVILTPDKRHSPLQIFNLVKSSPDKIESRLVPTHSFVSNFLEAEGSDKELAKIVDRSFLKQQILALTPENAEKRLNKMNLRFKQFSNMLQSSELECFTKENGRIVATPKGSIVAKARGIDGLLFAETIFKAPLETLKPSQLAAVACYLSFGDEKNKAFQIEGCKVPAMIDRFIAQNDRTKIKIQTVETDKEIIPIIENIAEIKSNIKNIETKYEILNKEIIPNIQSMPFMQKWAEAPLDDSLESWQGLVKEMSNDKLDEGDLFKSVNSTVDILKQMQEASELVAKKTQDIKLQTRMKLLGENAVKAVEMLKKSPIAELHIAKSLRI